MINLMAKCDTKNKWALSDQIQRSAISIPSNIAEGYERNSINDFIRFLHIAKGSCGELRTQIYLAKGVGMITGGEVDELIGECKRISGMIQGLINHLRGVKREQS